MRYTEEQEPIPRWQALYRFGYQKLRKVYRFGAFSLMRTWGVVNSIYPHMSRQLFGRNYPKVLILPPRTNSKIFYSRKRPSVSVIMPFKNRKSFLAESVASALNSEHVNLELILVDDGSDDGSSEIAQEFSERNENVVYFRVPNSLGAYVSRNIGMMAASGDYIAFLDSDDIHDPLRLIKQIRVLQKNPGIRLTLTGANRFFQNFNGAPTYRVLFASISMVFHSSLIKEQGYFDSVRFGGDSEYLFRVLRNFPAPAIALLRASLYSIRLSEGSLTTSGAGSYYPDGNLNNRQSLSKSRQQYVAAYKDAHKLKGFFFVPFYQTERLIPFGDSENIVIVPELGELLPRNEISSEGSRVTSGVCAPKPNHKDLHGAEE